jgi:phospholipid N-methyltransferase
MRIYERYGWDPWGCANNVLHWWRASAEARPRVFGREAGSGRLLAPGSVRRREHDDPGEGGALCATHGIQPKKSLGQNFLVDANVARRVASLAELADNARVLEIGPGLGSLTSRSVNRARVVAVELDARLAAVLTGCSTKRRADRVQVEVADAAKADLEALLASPGGDDGPVTCVSNLPYNVAVPVVMHVLEDVPSIARIVVMVQREVGASRRRSGRRAVRRGVGEGHIARRHHWSAGWHRRSSCRARASIPPWCGSTAGRHRPSPCPRRATCSPWCVPVSLSGARCCGVAGTGAGHPHHRRARRRRGRADRPGRGARPRYVGRRRPLRRGAA